MFRKYVNCQNVKAIIPDLTRHVHHRHHPNDVVSVSYPKPDDFEKVKDKGPAQWPYYGGRINVSKKWRQPFPQVLPIVDTTPVDIRNRQVDRAMQFGGNPCTYPTLLVYPDGSTISVPYHKPVGTIYLPGDDTQISMGLKAKVKVKRRVKIGL